MNLLIHFKKQRLEKLNQELILQNEKFVKKDFNLDKTLLSLLNEVQDYFQQIGESTKEGNISQLKNYLDLAVSGIDPIKLERIKTRRRDTVRIACFHCLSNLGETIESSLIEVENILLKATETIHQVVLSAYQSKFINDTIINKTNTVEEAIMLWDKLKENEQILLIDKKLRLEIHQQDTGILIDQTLSKLKTKSV